MKDTQFHVELLLSCRVAGVAVWMVFDGEGAVGLLDGVELRALGHTEHIIVVAFRHGQ